MKEIVIYIKMPAIQDRGNANELSNPSRPIMLLREDGLDATRYSLWKDRCYIEREKRIKPHASPALKT